MVVTGNSDTGQMERKKFGKEKSKRSGSAEVLESV
jgi:hypothetical protein